MKRIETLVADLQQRGVNDESLNKMLANRDNLLKKYNDFKNKTEEHYKQSATMIKASLDTNESQIRAKIKELLKANRTDEEKAKIAKQVAKMQEGRQKKQGKLPENDKDDDYFHKEKWIFGI